MKKATRARFEKLFYDPQYRGELTEKQRNDLREVMTEDALLAFERTNKTLRHLFESPGMIAAVPFLLDSTAEDDGKFSEVISYYLSLGSAKRTVRYGNSKEGYETIKYAEILRRIRKNDFSTPMEKDRCIKALASKIEAGIYGENQDLEMLSVSGKLADRGVAPSVAQMRQSLALEILEEYRRLGLNPRKQDIRREAELRLAPTGPKLNENQEKNAWKRVWEHPVLQGVAQGRRGIKAIPLPKESDR